MCAVIPVTLRSPANLGRFYLLPHCDAWQIYSSAAYGRMTNWSFVNPECNNKTKGFVLKEVGLSEKARLLLLLLARYCCRPGAAH